MSVQGQRGRKVAPNKRQSLSRFYIVVGAVVIVAIAALVTVLLRNNSNDAPINAPIGVTADGFYYKGSPDAPVKVVKYSDYQCPACAFYDAQLAPIIERDYIETGQVQFIYHEFPLDIHANAAAAGEAARCAGDQGQYWAMHDALFRNQSQWANQASPLAAFGGYAGQIGLNRAEFEACMADGRHTADIAAAGESAIAAGVPATPTFNVNGQLVDSSGLVSAIEAALRATQ
jgi:protein-disulfide isomerase